MYMPMIKYNKLLQQHLGQTNPISYLEKSAIRFHPPKNLNHNDQLHFCFFPTMLAEENDARTAILERITTHKFPPSTSISRAAAKVELEKAGEKMRADDIATLIKPLACPNDDELGALSFMRIMLNLNQAVKDPVL